ncbi:hypothetical protein ES708_24631 [subsurface metagenome]
MGSLKKLYGYYKAGKTWKPILVAVSGKIVISAIPEHHLLHEIGGSDEVSGLIPQYLIAKWDYDHGAIPTGWSLYEAGDYSIDLLVDGTPSADSLYPGYFEAYKACDDDNVTRWGSANTDMPHWWKYDFGNGIRYSITKLTILGNDITYGLRIKDFTLQGSNNDIDWTIIYTGVQANNTNVQTYTFDNDETYRYYKINITSNHDTSYPKMASVKEFEMMKPLAAFIIKD